MRTIPKFNGLCMEGNAEAFARGLYELRDTQPEDQEFQYVEIGVASGGTLRTVVEILALHEKPWRVTGIDIPGGWSLHTEGIRAGMIAVGGCEIGPLRFAFPMGCVEVILERDYIANHWSSPIDFAFIDGCHGDECVTRDFLSVASFVRSGGLVCFHDANESCQGMDLQPHCGTGIAVRAALRNLALLDGSRPGWVKVEETVADRSLLIAQRIETRGS